MPSVVHSVVWRGARNGLWLSMRSGDGERTKRMKGRGVVMEGKAARVVA